MKIRSAVLSAAVTASLVGVGACSTIPGSASSLTAHSAATATVTAAVSTASATETAPPPLLESSAVDAGAAPRDSPAPANSDVAEPTEGSRHGRNPAATSDATTSAWVSGICGGMGTVMNELVDSKPHLPDDASVSTLRRAMVDYYRLSAKTAATAYEDAQALEPPKVADGPAIHQAYRDFVGGLQDIFDEAAISISRAADVPAIEAINNEVDQHITTLGTDNTALQAMSGGELAALAKTIPACKDLSDTVAGS